MSREGQVWRAAFIVESGPGSGIIKMAIEALSWGAAFIVESVPDSGALWVVVRDEGESHLMLCLDSSGVTTKLSERALATGRDLMNFLKWDRIA